MASPRLPCSSGFPDGYKEGVSDPASQGKRWRVQLPNGAAPPFQVFVNGVPQKEGDDFEVEDGALAFTRALAQEGKLGFSRWALMFFNIRGSYAPNDSVDVQYQLAGRTRVATGLEIVPPR